MAYKILRVEPDLSKWAPWSPEEVARRLAGVAAPWYVAAGWAIDLFLGEQTREHEDIEIAVPRTRLGEVVEALGDYELFAVDSGVVWRIGEAGDLPESSHQTWVQEHGTELWRLDIFSEPSEGATWICRRDFRIRLPYDRVIERTADGIPYGRPEIILLFKAKHVRPKDETDFAAVVPRLDAAQREWLADALTLAHPGHHWLRSLRAP